jgi:hypothetical protein
MAFDNVDQTTPVNSARFGCTCGVPDFVVAYEWMVASPSSRWKHPARSRFGPAVSLTAHAPAELARANFEDVEARIHKCVKPRGRRPDTVGKPASCSLAVVQLLYPPRLLLVSAADDDAAVLFGNRFPIDRGSNVPAGATLRGVGGGFEHRGARIEAKSPPTGRTSVNEYPRSLGTSGDGIHPQAAPASRLSSTRVEYVKLTVLRRQWPRPTKGAKPSSFVAVPVPNIEDPEPVCAWRLHRSNDCAQTRAFFA